MLKELDNTYESVADLVSVIVPVYNAEKYLRQNIESILNQSYKNIEIILITDLVNLSQNLLIFWTITSIQ